MGLDRLDYSLKKLIDCRCCVIIAAPSSELMAGIICGVERGGRASWWEHKQTGSGKVIRSQ